MLRLHAFGGLTLERDGEFVTGALTHRRQLALLALLAVAGDQGLSREKLLAFLWPEGSTEQARHALNQLIYLQRQRAGDSDPFSGRKTLRLRALEVESDVQEFEAALAAGQPEQAVEVYRGAFLDGFFLDGAEAFEQWTAEYRARFADRYLGALEGLADRAAAAGDLLASVEWRRRAAATDPLNSRLAGAHVESLMACGNRAGALRSLQQHTDRLRNELGLGPDTELQLLEARIRDGGTPRMS